MGRGFKVWSYGNATDGGPPLLGKTFLMLSSHLLQPNPPFRLLKEMRDNHIPPEVLCSSAAITACGKGGKWEEALRYGP